jgi:hypothetical protein
MGLVFTTRKFSRSVMTPISSLLWRLRGVALKLRYQRDSVLQEVNPPDVSPHRLRFLKESAQSYTIRRRFQQDDVLHDLF